MEPLSLWKIGNYLDQKSTQPHWSLKVDNSPLDPNLAHGQTFILFCQEDSQEIAGCHMPEILNLRRTTWSIWRSDAYLGSVYLYRGHWGIYYRQRGCFHRERPENLFMIKIKDLCQICKQDKVSSGKAFLAAGFLKTTISDWRLIGQRLPPLPSACPQSLYILMLV